MEIGNRVKDKVIACLFHEIQNRKISQAEFARIVAMRHGIKFDKAVFPQVKNEDNRNYSVIKDSSWLTLARHYHVLEDNIWETVQTQAYISVQAHLEKCQEFGTWQVLCDRAGIGKSYAATEYAREHKNVFYIDCSEYPGKCDLIRYFAGLFGLQKTGGIDRLWRDAVNELLLLDKPLIIWDEFGDCAEAVISLAKGLYNRADVCGGQMTLGCYFIGADNLQQRLQDGRRTKKRSYAEFWSRFNGKITGLNYAKQQDSFAQQLRNEVERIVDANLPEELAEKRDKVIERSLETGGVRAIRNEIAIQKMLAQKKGQLGGSKPLSLEQECSRIRYDRMVTSVKTPSKSGDEYLFALIRNEKIVAFGSVQGNYGGGVTVSADNNGVKTMCAEKERLSRAEGELEKSLYQRIERYKIE